MPPEAKPPQELRLAVVMTGGVSLAIWMGGVASEIDQLLRARHEQVTTEQEVYEQLLTLSGYQPRVDVVSGTSAGGVNGALLAGAVARHRSLVGLREVWLDVADFEALLRSPYETDQPSVLKGDEYFTPELRDGIEQLLGEGTVTPEPGEHPLTLLVTTTLLNGEDSQLVDDFGTQIPDVRHNGLFKFDRTQLMEDPLLIRRLALAARSSASFPVAFEPSWVPCNDAAADGPHPSMKGIADFHGSHFVIDGGVLMNRPIEPALKAMFAMPADAQDVRRVVLYVVPDPGETLEPIEEELATPFDLTDVAIKSLVTVPRTQSIAGDLERLTEHNARVREQRQAREVILMRWFPVNVAEIADLLGGYSDRRAERDVELLLTELTLRWPTSITQDMDFKPLDRQRLVRKLVRRRRKQLPSDLQAHVGAWGIDSLERAATVTLDLVGRGHAAAERGSDAHKTLAKARKRTHHALDMVRERRAARRGKLRDRDLANKEPIETWTSKMLDMLREDDRQLLEIGDTVGRALRDAASAIHTLQDEEPLKQMISKLVPRPNSADGEVLRRLFALEVLHSAVGLTSPVVEQPISLLQVSANTRDGISTKKSAADKLTGMRLAHFAAFYKPSWRANDWMWGRLDAAGWLAQLLLEPSRLALAFPGGDGAAAKAMERISEIALGPAGDERAWLEQQLKRDAAAMRKELAWLDKPDGDIPTALPICSLAVARRIQLSILQVELPGVAAAVNADEARDALSPTGKLFRAAWKDVASPPTPEQCERGLKACNFASKGFADEYDSGLLARSGSGAAATTASALAGKQSGLPGFVTKSKLITSLRGLALAVHGLLDAAVRRSRIAFAGIIVLTAAAGALLGAAIVAEGSQPGLTTLGFTILLAAWIVALVTHRHFWRNVGWTVLVIGLGLGFALLPRLATLIEPCPAGEDCFRGDVETFILDLEPIFIVIALVVGAAAFGWRAVAPPAQTAD